MPSVPHVLAAALLVTTTTVASPATFVVSTDADSGPGSLREAITPANADGFESGDTTRWSGVAR